MAEHLTNYDGQSPGHHWEEAVRVALVLEPPPELTRRLLAQVPGAAAALRRQGRQVPRWPIATIYYVVAVLALLALSSLAPKLYGWTASLDSGWLAEMASLRLLLDTPLMWYVAVLVGYLREQGLLVLLVVALWLTLGSHHSPPRRVRA